MEIKKEMIKKKTWEEFKNTGLLWFINTILHAFGWAIVLECDNKVITAFPARVRFRGFSQQANDKNYLKLTEYMANNSNDLLKEVEEELNNEEENL